MDGIEAKSVYPPSIRNSNKTDSPVVFVEPEASGHHISLYGRAILKEGIRRGWKWIWLTSPHALEHPASIRLLEETKDRVIPLVVNFPRLPESTGRGEWILYEWQHFHVLRTCLKMLRSRHAVSSIYLSWLDYFPRMLGAFGVPLKGLRYSGMHMHPTLHLPGKRSPIDNINRWLNRRIYSRSGLSRVAVVTEPFFHHARNSNLPGSEKIVLVPEMAGLGEKADRAEARHNIHARPSDCVLLVYGALSERKGIANLAAACGQIKEPEKWVIWFAGSQDSSAREIISRLRVPSRTSGVRIVESDWFLSDEEEAEAFAAADIAWLGYQVNLGGSSGVLMLAASAEVPVLSCNEGVVGETVRSKELGLTVDITNPAAVAAALDSLRLDPTNRQVWSRNGRKLAAGHHPSAIARHVVDMIDSIS